ncbi:MAG: hypothetical protein QOH69_1259 [Actinomycetota bacterium]|jgi:uncharacterized protein with FMN-binding domain|nr:hypothetical protein [Actinomycetota bacterium]MDQ1552793.1 hypothetical protein [Actinomycetota bacterium]
MYVRGARITLAAVSGVALVGALAGCGVQTVDATVTGFGDDSKTAAPVAAKPTPSDTATAVATSAPTATAKPTTAPTKVVAPAPSASPSSSPSATPPPPAAPTSTYKDGNYSATGTYNSPGGHETLRVTIDMANDVITALAVTSVKIDSTAAAYETAFEGGIQDIVVGKDIDSLNVGPVAGSSLTSIGFNRAITTIKGLAKN